MGTINSTNAKSVQATAVTPAEEKEKDEFPHLGTVSVKLSW
jgi:hypothetical protein